VTINPTSDAVAATAETANFAVTVTGPGGTGKTWTATKDVAWLTIVAPTAPQTASGTVTYAVAANTGAARVGKITVNGKIFTVNQSAAVVR
jgi:hypothetical protein